MRTIREHVGKTSQWLMLLLAIAAIASFTVACGSDDDSSASSSGSGGELVLPSDMKIGTGSVGGSFYVWGSALAQVLEAELGIPVSAEPTAGTDENIRLIDSGEADIVGVTMNRTYLAFKGEGKYEKAYDQMRVVASVYPSPLMMITRTDSGINTMADLAGKKIGMGVSRGWDVFMEPVFTAHGIDFESLDRVYAGIADMHTQLQDGNIDATSSFISGGNLNGSTKQLMTQRDLKIIPFTQAGLDAVNGLAGFMQPVLITKEQLAGLHPTDYTGIDVGLASIMVNASMSDALASKIAEIIHTKIDTLAETGPQFGLSRDDNSIWVSDTGLPFHPGAAAYWKSAGIMN